MRILLKSGIKKQIQSIMAISILFMIITLSIVVATSINNNSGDYISSEMNRLGFGDETIWISTNREGESSETTIENFKDEIGSLDDVDNVSSQNLIFAAYSIGERSSDDEGQMILYEPEKYDYKFLNNSASDYEEVSVIEKGDIYVSPTVASNFQAQIGDEITFRLSRNGDTQTFNIAGYFEDPFMGSSMIDMKSFLIGNEDYENMISLINESDSFNTLARSGAMLHIFQEQGSYLSHSQLSGFIQSNTSIGNYFEFAYSYESIEGFMMILQNIMVGFLITFAIILSIICVIIISYSISNSIENDYMDMAILKTVGATSKNLRIIQILQYIVGEVSGILIGIIISYFVLGVIDKEMVYSTGLLMPGGISLIKSLSILGVVILLFALFIYFKTKKIMEISPVSAMQGRLSDDEKKSSSSKINATYPLSSYTFRQVMLNKKRYVGTVMVSFLLVCLVVTVNKMNGWLGPNGEGLMNSFSVAEHDLGIQPNHEMDMTEVENVIRKYTNIVDTYELAMQSGTVEGVDYTINVLDEPSWFYVLSGRRPASPEELIVTEYVASDLGVVIGDKVSVSSSGGTAQYTIVGIYSCANEMGANVGMTRDGYGKIGNVNDFIWCKHYVFSDSLNNETIMQELQNIYPMDMDVHTNSWSGLNSIVDMMKLITKVMYAIVFVVILVVVMLTTGKLLQMEQYDLAILKSLGVTASNLRIAFMVRLSVLSFIGGIMGSIVTIIFGDSIISRLLSSFGISNFNSGVSIIGNLIIPFIIVGLFAVISYLYTGKIKKIDIMELIRKV